MDDPKPTPGDIFYLAVGKLETEAKDKFQDTVLEANLTRSDMTNEFAAGYSIRLYTTGCYYFSKDLSTWRSDGCKVKEII